MSNTLREIQKYHDGRYRSVDMVYVCGEIGNPDKERAFVPLDKVLEIIDKHGEQLVHNIVDGRFPEIIAADVLASVREDVLALKGGEL